MHGVKVVTDPAGKLLGGQGSVRQLTEVPSLWER